LILVTLEGTLLLTATRISVKFDFQPMAEEKSGHVTGKSCDRIDLLPYPALTRINQA